MRVDNNMLIGDIIKAVKFFSGIDVDVKYIQNRIAKINFNDNNIAHYGVNKLAKEISRELMVP